MAADSPYFDTSYLARLYLRDHGFEEVREFAGHGINITSAWHAQAAITACAIRARSIPNAPVFCAASHAKNVPLTREIFLLACFHSPWHPKLDPNQTTSLKHEMIADARQAVADFVKPAQIFGFTIAPVLLDSRLS